MFDYIRKDFMPSLNSSDDNKFGGSWSLTKLKCIEKYIYAYLDVMKDQGWATLWYIDAFAGAGLQELKNDSNLVDSSDLIEIEEEGIRLIRGSSLRAVSVSSRRERGGRRGFDRYVFIELNSDKLEELRNQINTDFPDQIDKCSFICGDVNNELPKLLSSMNWSSDRAIAFVDPCAMQVEWKTIESFENTCVDLWLLFPLASALRILPLKHMPNDGWMMKLNSFFGDEGWAYLYKEPEQLALFEEEAKRIERSSGVAELLDYTGERLRTIFPGVLKPAILRISNGSPYFALFSLISNHSYSAIGISQNIARHLLNGIGD